MDKKNLTKIKGKISIVTGANSGTGYGIAYHLANNGSIVIMAGRNKAKLLQAKEDLLKEVPKANLILEIVDLTSLISIEDFCNRIKKDYSKIDYLANNAGGGANVYKETKDNLEANFTLNYLGHFALTTQLLPLLKNGSRIVNYSSIGYKKFLKQDLDINNIMCKNAKDYNQMQEYCKAKLCSILHAVKLQKIFDEKGITSKITSCHPGNARTNLMTQDDQSKVQIIAFKYLVAPLMSVFNISHSLYDGALPAIKALTIEDVRSDVVYSPSGKNEFTGNPIPIEIDRTHFKDSDIDDLWVKTQKILKINVHDYL